MKRTQVSSYLTILLVGVLLFLPGRLPAQAKAAPEHGHHHDHEHGHVAPHGGALSAIEGCGLGHVEAKVEAQDLTLWFLDGGDATHRSVPCNEARFPLSIVGPNGERTELMMLADPMRLAGEDGSRCSRFTAHSTALAGMPAFRAFGWVRFKGEMRALRIDFPQGYDPDHGTGDDHDDDHDHGPSTAAGKPETASGSAPSHHHP